MKTSREDAASERRKALDELAAQAQELNMGYEDGRTHHEKCWEDHADCARIHLRAALARVAELESELMHAEARCGVFQSKLQRADGDLAAAQRELEEHRAICAEFHKSLHGDGSYK